MKKHPTVNLFKGLSGLKKPKKMRTFQFNYCLSKYGNERPEDFSEVLLYTLAIRYFKSFKAFLHLSFPVVLIFNITFEVSVMFSICLFKSRSCIPLTCKSRFD